MVHQSFLPAIVTCSLVLCLGSRSGDCACVTAPDTESMKCSSFSETHTVCVLKKSVKQLPRLASKSGEGCSLRLTGGYSIGTIEEETFLALRVSELEISNIAFGQINPGAFQLLDAFLRDLTIQETNLEHISSDLFSGLISLERLSLQLNRIASIELGAFEDLINLKQLFIDGNRLSGIQESLFIPLLSLITLSLTSNEIKSLQEGAFLGLTGLRKLYLSKNKLDSINRGVFVPLYPLVELDLSNNEISTVEADTFLGSQMLVTLNLNNNLLPSFPARTFNDMASLQDLYLASNRIQFLEADAFLGSYNIVLIQLGNNSISYVDPNAFRNLPLLFNLDLTNNRLSSIPDELFWNLGRLRKVYLDGNKVDFDRRGWPHRNGPFKTQIRLTNLDFYKNSITYLPDGLFSGAADNKTIIVLDLSYNQISEAHPGAFEGIRLIYVCRLHHNRLTHLGENFFSGITILELYLSHNLIHHIEARTIRTCNYVLLHSNQLSHVTRGLFTEKNRIINLAGNKISSIDNDAFNNTNNVFVDLRFNNLGFISVSQLRGGSSKRRTFDLRGNPLRCFLPDIQRPDVTSCGAACVCLPEESLVCDCRSSWLTKAQEQSGCFTCTSQCHDLSVSKCFNKPELAVWGNYTNESCLEELTKPGEICPAYDSSLHSVPTDITTEAPPNLPNDTAALTDAKSVPSGAVAGGATAAVVIIVVVASGLIWKLRRRQQQRRAKRSQVTTSTSISTSESVGGSVSESLDVLPMDDCPSPGSVELGTRRAYKMGRF